MAKSKSSAVNPPTPAGVQSRDSSTETLLALVHAELRRLARRHMSKESPGHILQTTALVNEAYLRLIDATDVVWKDRAHFLAVASQIMRRILIDIARAKTYQKRGGRALHVTFSEDLPIVASDAETVLAVHHALDALSATHPRKARVVEMRFFGGMSLDEVGAVLEMSVETAKRDWKFARAWLRRELEHGRRGL